MSNTKFKVNTINQYLDRIEIHPLLSKNDQILKNINNLISDLDKFLAEKRDDYDELQIQINQLQSEVRNIIPESKNSYEIEHQTSILTMQNTKIKKNIELNESSNVLVIGCEGNADVKLYKQLLSKGRR